jgi:hypothetical protein
MKKLLIAKAGKTFPAVKGIWGDFEDFIITQMGLDEKDVYVISIYEKEPLPSLREISGMIITGSHNYVTRQEDWNVKFSEDVKEVAQRGIPILGISYGHQLIAQAFGGEVGYHPKGIEIGTVIAPFIYIEMVSDGILKGLGEQMSCLKYSMVDSIFRISMIYFIIPYKGLTAFIGIMIVSNIITSLLNFNKLIQVTNIKIEVSKWILKPFIAALATTLLSKTMYRYLFFSGGYQTQGVIFSIAIAMMLYATFLVLIESISTEDIKWFRNSVRIIMS